MRPNHGTQPVGGGQQHEAGRVRLFFADWKRWSSARVGVSAVSDTSSPCDSQRAGGSAKGRSGGELYMSAPHTRDTGESVLAAADSLKARGQGCSGLNKWFSGKAVGLS